MRTGDFAPHHLHKRIWRGSSIFIRAPDYCSKKDLKKSWTDPVITLLLVLLLPLCRNCYLRPQWQLLSKGYIGSLLCVVMCNSLFVECKLNLRLLKTIKFPERKQYKECDLSGSCLSHGAVAITAECSVLLCNIFLRTSQYWITILTFPDTFIMLQLLWFSPKYHQLAPILLFCHVLLHHHRKSQWRSQFSLQCWRWVNSLLHPLSRPPLECYCMFLWQWLNWIDLNCCFSWQAVPWLSEVSLVQGSHMNGISQHYECTMQSGPFHS